MIFNIIKQSTDNRIFAYHMIIDRRVNMLNFKITVVIRSYQSLLEAESDSANNVEFIVEIHNSDYNPDYLIDLESKVINLVWLPYRKQPALIEVPVFNLEEMKLKKRNEINLTRDLLEKDGFQYMGHIIDSDIVSAIRISIATQAAQIALANNQPFELEWACKDNAIITINAQQMIEMSVTMATYANTLHLHSRVKKDLIDAATTQEELEAIVW